MKAIKTILEPDKGIELYESHRIAITYCAEHRIDVEYKFNGNLYGVQYNNLVAAIESIKIL